jgi:hypothetical protein
MTTRIGACKCGCGAVVRGRRTFVNKEHQLAWMMAGGAREMNALLPDEVRERGGHTSGTQAVASGRLRDAGEKGAARSREIAVAFRRRQMDGDS